MKSETGKLVGSAFSALGEYPTGIKGKVQFPNNKHAQSLNLPAVKNTVLLYFKKNVKKGLQAQQEAYKDAVIQIILSHRLCMLNLIFCSIFNSFFKF